ncbi:Ribose-5-phosphate isomerase A [Paenibacillus konkukensis]|uniref:Ribose 5-phosphate isomerase A n=2 Tax=Paenibacillus konkukensis TaxID=2020716 RepID=A0ABY4RFQ6_9BACL|nr:Ribose-5-phosphate isomerase A [Paenibacillus konkukensis]
MPFAGVDEIDMTIDGADEVDACFNLIKGGGGALLREKILAANSRKLVIIVDETKQVGRLGKFPLPVEIIPFAAQLTLRQLRKLGCDPEIRTAAGGQNFITDNGNLIADCRFGAISDPKETSLALNRIPGVVENGLFCAMTDTLIVGHADGRVTAADRP